MRGAVALVVLCMLVVVGCGESRVGRSLPGLKGDKLARLETVVRVEMQESPYTDRHPSSVTVFTTLRHQARVAEGPAGSAPGRPGSQRVYLVVVRGHFDFTGCCMGGPGTRVPRPVDVMTLMLDRKTLRV